MITGYKKCSRNEKVGLGVLRITPLTFAKCNVELDQRLDFHQNSEGEPSKNQETLPSMEDNQSRTRLNYRQSWEAYLQNGPFNTSSEESRC